MSGFFLKGIFLFMIIPIFGIYTVAGQIPFEVKLYKNAPSKEQEGRRYNHENELTHIYGAVVPRLLVYKPDKACGAGIIVCPGGGYSKMNVENTRFIAERLTKLGITVFVLVYRLPVNDSTALKPVAALQDVQQAFRIVRENALQWGLSPDRLGLWGSSAGGHLAAMAATHYSQSFAPGRDTSGLRPDFLILAWPVVSFRSELVHKGSMKNLLGDNPSEKEIAFYSPNEWVDETTSPTFLVHAADDAAVPVGNSIRFFEALKKSNVPAELHVYESGGHGFGVDPDVKDFWISQLEIWLRKRDLIGNN